MPTPRGKGLAGSAAGREHEDWADRTRARVNEQQAAKQKKARRTRPANILLEFKIPFLALLRAAADSRGMSSAGYARRAVAAFVAKDLGLPFEEITANFSAPHMRGEVLKRDPGEFRKAAGATEDDGKGYGDWRVR
jgi:hypothetical protein